MASAKRASGVGGVTFGVAVLIVEYVFPNAEPWLTGLLLILFIVLATIWITLTVESRKHDDAPHIHLHLGDLVREAVQSSLDASVGTGPLPSVVVTPQTAAQATTAPLPPAIATPPKAEATATDPQDQEIQPPLVVNESEVYPPTVRSITKLYVGQVIVSGSRLAAEENALEIAVRAFNGSSETLRVIGIEGAISAAIGNAIGLPLSTPTWRPEHCAEPIPEGREFTVVLDQRVSPSVAEEWLEALGNDNYIALDLRGLGILVQSEEAPQLRVPLPLWDGASIRRRDDLFTGRIFMASVGVAVETSASLTPGTVGDD